MKCAIQFLYNIILEREQSAGWHYLNSHSKLYRKGCSVVEPMSRNVISPNTKLFYSKTIFWFIGFSHEDQSQEYDQNREKFCLHCNHFDKNAIEWKNRGVDHRTPCVIIRINLWLFSYPVMRMIVEYYQSRIGEINACIHSNGQLVASKGTKTDRAIHV